MFLTNGAPIISRAAGARGRASASYALDLQLRDLRDGLRRDLDKADEPPAPALHCGKITVGNRRVA